MTPSCGGGPWTATKKVIRPMPAKNTIVCCRGGLSAFEGIVRRWQGPLVNMAFRFCHDRGRAEDMAQEAFVRAFRGLGTWRRGAAFSTWLFALAANLYRNEIRRIPPRTVTLDLINEPADPR